MRLVKHAFQCALQDKEHALFPGGVFWLFCGPQCDIAALQKQLLSQLGGPVGTSRARDADISTEERLRERLHSLGSHLLVLDDVSERSVVEAFSSVGTGKLLVTTQYAALLPEISAACHKVTLGMPGLSDALDILYSHAVLDKNTAPLEVRPCRRDANHSS